MPENILVTGGAGFIGSHLCEALLAQGHKVLCLDNFCDFYDPQIKMTNISECRKQPNFSLIECDITDLDELSKAFSYYKIDLVVHLAAMAGVRPSIQNPELYEKVNVAGTLNLLQLCKIHGIGRFIFASSSSVYGNNAKLPFSESDNVDNPISPYAATKKAGELLCHTYHYLDKMSIICLRFFTVYGPRQRPDLAICKFASLLESGEALPVFGDGTSSRDYTYIGDIIQGVMRSIQYVQDHLCYEIINLGNDRGIGLLDMILNLEQVFHKEARLDFRVPQDGDIPHTLADISIARRLLGYQPRTSFAQGMQSFAEWWKCRLS
ncbi:MAG: SDR family NAD(P)-dependent oxidoreductase [Candidatus Cloacimonadaceae bacterium]|nr:SDR family NAD(P)-dependent oxidoreductase [Candidatus Cloacimonadaceae bacterium]